MRLHIRCLLPLVASLALVSPVSADDDLSIDAPPLFPEGFSVRLSGAVWAPRFDGDVKVAGELLDLRDDLDHGDTRWVPWGDVDLRHGRWGLRVSGYTVSEDAVTTAQRDFTFGDAAASVGDRVSSDLSIDSVQVEGSVTLWRPFAAQRWPWGEPRELTAEELVRARSADLRFGLVVGARWVGLDHDVDVRNGGGAILGADSRDADWIAVYGGPSLEIVLRTRQAIGFLDHVVVGGMAGVGGDVAGDGGTMLEVRAGIDLMFTPNIGLSLGYRLQNFDFEEGDYTYDGSLQGLIVGATLRF